MSGGLELPGVRLGREMVERSAATPADEI